MRSKGYIKQLIYFITIQFDNFTFIKETEYVY